MPHSGVDSPLLAVGTLSAYLLVLVVPGLAVALAAGLRGWVLAGMTPLLSYAVLGLAGPWLDALGVPFGVASAAAVTVVIAALILGLRGIAAMLRRACWPLPSRVLARPDARVGPSRRAHVAVAGCVLLAMAMSVTVVLGAAEGVVDAIFQRWDPVFHAGGIRYISETGDGGLYGVSSVNRYGPEGSLFYPNAYHLAGALVRMLTGASVPLVMNVMAMPVAGLLALSLATLVRECGGRPMLAGAAAIVAGVATNAVYESIANGLLPFALSVALTPLGAVALRRFLVRPGVGTGAVLALGGAGLLAVHSSALFAAVLFAAPLLVWHWRSAGSTPARDLLRLGAVAVAGGILTAPHLAGALGHANGGYEYRPWASDMPVIDALRSLVLFQHDRTAEQLVLMVLLVVGVLTARRLGGLRWVVASSVVLGAFWVLVASAGGAGWVTSLSRPWWNDRFRLLALAMIPLCLLAAHGFAELLRWLAWMSAGRSRGVVAVGASVVVGGLAVASDGFYLPTNTVTVAHAYHNAPVDKVQIVHRPAVSEQQAEAMHRMAALAEPGERVLNDRSDGSTWLYALTGVPAVAGHYDAQIPPRDAAYLAENFRDYRSDPEVGAALDRLNVRHVFVGSGQVWPLTPRAPGLSDLDDVDFLDEVYRNPDAVIYRIRR